MLTWPIIKPTTYLLPTGGVSYTVGGAAAPPTLRFPPPTKCFATPIFVGFRGFLTPKWWCLSFSMQNQARIQGGRPPLGRKDLRRRRGFPRLKGRKKGHWCLLNGYSTPFRHNMAINTLKSCKSVFAYVQKSLIPIPYKVIIPLAPSPGRNPGSAPENCHICRHFSIQVIVFIP